MTEEEEFEQRWRLEQAQKAQSRQAMTHYPAPKTQEERLKASLGASFGVPSAEVDVTTGAPLLTRLMQGILADTPEEEMSFASGVAYPGAPTAAAEGFIGINPASGPPSLINPPGFDFGDVAEFAGRSGPAIVGALAGGAAGGAAGPFAPVVGAGVGVAAAESAREGLQALAGSQEETFGQFGTRAALGAAMEGIPLLGRGVRAAKNLVIKHAGQELSEAMGPLTNDDLVGLVQSLKDANIVSLPDLLNYQKSDNPVLQRIAYQAVQMSSKAQGRLMSQLQGLGAAAKSRAGDLDVPGGADRAVQDRLAKAYKDQRGALAPKPDPSVGGLALQQGVRGGLKDRKSAMKNAYGELDTLVGTWSPKYDMSSAQRAARERQTRGMGVTPKESAEVFGAAGGPLGSTWFKSNPQYFNVETPGARLNRINEAMARLDPRQDYETVQLLRSQVGSLLDNPMARNMEGGADIGQAKIIYRELSEALEDPRDVVEGARKGIVNKTRQANRLAKRYYDTYDNARVRDILTSEEGQAPVGVFNAFANTPTDWEESFISVLQDARKNSGDLANIRRNVSNVLLRSDDPLKVVNNWNERNPQALNWLYPDPQKRSRLLHNASALTEMNSGVLREANDAATERVGFAMRAIQERGQMRSARGGTAEQNFGQLVGDVGGEGSEGHQALRSALFTDAIDSSLKTHPKSGADVLDPKVLARKVKEMEGSGAWGGILTERDRKAMQGLEQYARTVSKTGDAGTGLTVAAQVGQLRGGDPGAAVSIFTSIRLANWLTDTKIPFSSLTQRVAKGADPLVSPAATAILRGAANTLGAGVRQGILATEATEATQ